VLRSGGDNRCLDAGEEDTLLVVQVQHLVGSLIGLALQARVHEDGRYVIRFVAAVSLADVVAVDTHRSANVRAHFHAESLRATDLIEGQAIVKTEDQLFQNHRVGTLCRSGVHGIERKVQGTRINFERVVINIVEGKPRGSVNVVAPSRAASLHGAAFVIESAKHYVCTAIARRPIQIQIVLVDGPVGIIIHIECRGRCGRC
jgi:hypothetical protein